MKELDEIYVCRIKQMEIPIGVNVKGKITGLDISYEYSNDTLNKLSQLGRLETTSMHSAITSTNSISRRKHNLSSNKYVKSRNTTNLDKTMKTIDFKNVKVNKYYTFKFVLKNLCGITTNFNFKSKNYSPGIEKDLKFEMMGSGNNKESFVSNNNTTDVKNSISNINKLNTNSSVKLSSDVLNNFNDNNITTQRQIKTLNSLRNSQVLNSKSNKKFSINHPLLNDDHEQIIFTSKQGIEHTRLKQLEKESHMYLSNKKGVALVIEPNQGRLDPYSEVHVLITIYNECVGDFEDELISQVKGLPEKRFPVNIKIRGNPLQLAPFQTGINYNEEPPVMNLGNVITKVNFIQKSFKVINTGANLIQLDWKVYDFTKILNPDKDMTLFKVNIVENKNNFSLKYTALEPEQFSKDNEKFTIEPNNFLIQPKGHKDFNVKFRTNEGGISSALVVAYPKFMDNYTSNVKLSELAIKIDGNGINPKIYVDKTVILN